MKHVCRACGLELWMIDGPDFGVHFCRRCDTAPHEIDVTRRAGPPSLSFTDPNGWFSLPLTGGQP